MTPARPKPESPPAFSFLGLPGAELPPEAALFAEVSRTGALSCGARLDSNLPFFLMVLPS